MKSRFTQTKCMHETRYKLVDYGNGVADADDLVVRPHACLCEQEVLNAHASTERLQPLNIFTCAPP